MSASFNEEWMPFFGDRFWESERVVSLSDSAALLYQWLLWRQWKHESLPPPETLERVVPGRWSDRWSDLWSEMEALFEVCPDGRLRNETLAVERTIAEEMRSKARDRARKGARAANKARWGDRSSDTQANAQASPAGRTDRTVPTDSTKPDRTNPPRGAARARSSPHAEFIAWWMQEWERTRLGTAYAFQDAKDGNAVSWLLKRPEGVEEVKVRALRLLESTDAWEAKNASLSLLRSRWNAMAVDVRRMTKQDQNDAAFRQVAQKLAAKETLNGRS